MTARTNQEQEFPPPCGRCGKPPAAHLGWEQGHLFIRRMSYQETTEVQPHGADATAAGTRSITEGLTEQEARDRGLLPPRVKGALAAQLDAQETASAALAETIANPPDM